MSNIDLFKRTPAAAAGAGASPDTPAPASGHASGRTGRIGWWALGIGLGEAVGAAEGFGILAMCSVGPIITVLGTGLWIDMHTRTRHRRKLV